MARKRRKARGGRPRKVEIKRYTGGRPVQPEPIGPTEELKAHIAAHGPTCPIQRAVHLEWITQDEGRALDLFASYRAAAGFSRQSVIPVEGRMQGVSGGQEMDEEKRARATEAYREGSLAVRLCGVRSAHTAVRQACDGEAVSNPAALKAGASALKAVYIDGMRRIA